MPTVTKKTEVGPLDGTPDKRMFWSIISDYDLKTGVCELVDNALDSWIIGGQKKPLNVQIILDPNRQLISVTDDAGGVKQDQLRMLLAPGGSVNDPYAEVIGIFGVGSKRAGVALGERARLRTRFRSERTFEIDITEEWLATPDWELNYYEVPDISPRTTQVEISHLREPLAQANVEEMSIHLGETYDWFLRQNCSIKVNGAAVKAQSFQSWAFPPNGEPRSV